MVRKSRTFLKKEGPLLQCRKERAAETVVVAYTHRYAKVLLCIFSKYKGGLSEIELSEPIFGNLIILES